MKRLIILLTVYLITSLKLDAQNCIDTVHVKGYYVIMKSASEVATKITRKKDVTTVEQSIDIHRTPSFIPSDSINKKQPLSYWLNHFFDDTKQVFISCESIGLKYLVADCPIIDTPKTATCLFPHLKSNTLYKTTNLKTDNIFTIYYLDAYWIKLKIKKGTVQETMIPSRIAETAISPNIKVFDLYYFIKCDSVQMNPKLKDSHIKIWKK